MPTPGLMRAASSPPCLPRSARTATPPRSSVSRSSPAGSVQRADLGEVGELRAAPLLRKRGHDAAGLDGNLTRLPEQCDERLGLEILGHGEMESAHLVGSDCAADPKLRPARGEPDIDRVADLRVGNIDIDREPGGTIFVP